MKILLLTAMLSTGAIAETDCALYHSFGETIMKVRQTGASLAGLHEVLEESVANESDAEKLKLLANLAYDQPLYRTDESKQRAISEFANDLMLACIRANG